MSAATRSKGIVPLIIGIIVLVIGIIGVVAIAVVNSNTPLEGSGTPDGALQGVADVLTALAIGVGAVLTILGVLAMRRSKRSGHR
jgi:hypothetical protein